MSILTRAREAAAPALDALWIETPIPIGPAHGAVVLREAIARHPANPRLQLLLAGELRNAERYAEALPIFQAALALDPILAPAWAGAAACLRKLGRPADVLAMCDGDWAGDTADRFYERGRALLRLGRVAEGRDMLRQAAAREYPRIFALRALLESLARDGAAAEMLALCDTPDPAQQALALVRGYRAVALSMLGQVEAARALVDLEGGVRRYRFDPPAALGSVDQVNRRLAEAILADTPPGQGDVTINERPHLRAAAETRALRDFIRATLRDYIEQTGPVRAAAGMTASPRAASLGFGTVVLRGAGRNGQHLHPIGYLSTVYHVRVPQVAGGDGALIIGGCDELAKRHRACWGERRLPAAEGWLTIFPSHFFHDVAPTHSGEPRIAIVSDLNPQRASGRQDAWETRD